ncbi:hypothetical protein HPC49_24205 [Pyxidicoccus fallax]|uniref:Delta-60 repeat domain-containing protein n=1 Tax=Pyxidicoccus fallax TaxID=394095 RepID=A0A848LGP8_9BACT|nr:hypothetical protein [Pyxidicoccus fallax]NPC81319.1 hypothetical protein [Pyxidicoccus fallax]
MTTAFAGAAEAPLTLHAGPPSRVMDLSASADFAGSGPSLASLVAPGDFDPSFGTGGMALYQLSGATLRVDSVLVQPDDRLVVTGRLRSSTGCGVFASRYNADGTVDTTFAGGTGLVTTLLASGTCNATPAPAALQPDGKIVIASTRDQAGPTDFALLRYTASGAPDTTFGSGGLVIYNYVMYDHATDVAIQPDGRILLAGASSNNTNLDFVVARFTSTGALDSTFGFGGRATYGFASGSNDSLSDMVLQPDGKVLVVGLTYTPGTPDFGLVRFTASGALDSSFGSGGALKINLFGSTDQAMAVAVQTDGKILVGGNAYYPAGSQYYMTLLRLNASGTAYDTTFNGSGQAYLSFGPTDNIITHLAIQADGKIVAGGYTSLTSRGYNFDAALVRFLPTGALDSSFAGGGGFTYEGFTDSHDLTGGIGFQSDGKIIVGGTSANSIRLSRHGN